MQRLIYFVLLSVGLTGVLAGCGQVEATPVPTATVAEAADGGGTAVSPTSGPLPDNDIADCDQLYPGETITFYQQAGLTGPLAASFGDGFINGAIDAAQQINDAGGICGIQVKIRLEDSQYDPEQELSIYDVYRAETPKPPFIFTYGSGATIVLNERVIEDRIVNIAAGLDAEAFYEPADGWTVGVAPIYSDQFSGFLTWVKENWEAIKPEGAGDEIVVGPIGWANAFGNGATTPESLAYAESLGVTVLPLEEVEANPTADVTGQVQNLLASGANVIWIQSLSFGPPQVISTIHALGFWDELVVGGVNWAMDRNLLNILGENAALAEGFYGVTPMHWWNDTDNPAIQEVLAAFEAGGYPESDQGVSYLISYGGFMAARDVVQHALNRDGLENLSGESFFAAMKDLGRVSAAGIYELDVRDGNRAPRLAQIRQVQFVNGELEFVVAADFFTLPDTRP